MHNVIDSPAGLLLEKCDRMHVTGCTILDCDNVGLLVKASEKIQMSGNMIDDSRAGSMSVPVKMLDANGKTIEQ